MGYNLLQVQMEYVEIDSPEIVYFWAFKMALSPVPSSTIVYDLV